MWSLPKSLYYPGQKKKKNHRGDASCDIQESAAWFRRDASMREVAFARCSAAESSTVIPRYHKILILCISSMVLLFFFVFVQSSRRIRDQVLQVIPLPGLLAYTVSSEETARGSQCLLKFARWVGHTMMLTLLKKKKKVTWHYTRATTAAHEFPVFPGRDALLYHYFTLCVNIYACYFFFFSFFSLLCVCVCHNEKKVPYRSQAQQTTIASTMHDADKPTTERGPFQKSVTAILTEEKAKQTIESRQITVYLFWDRDRGRFTLAGVNWKGTNSEPFFFLARYW